MSRKQLTTTVTTFAFGAFVVAAAAYAPHSAALAKIAQKTVYAAPCSTIGFPASNFATPKEKPQQVAAYPVPSEDVIAKGHSGN